MELAVTTPILAAAAREQHESKTVFTSCSKAPRKSAGLSSVTAKLCRSGTDGRIGFLGPLAQLEEQLTLNQPVQGSSPWRLIRDASLIVVSMGQSITHGFRAYL